MERISLSKRAKDVLQAVASGQYTCPEKMLQFEFNSGARELQRHGLAYIHEEQKGNVEIVRLTDFGKCYLNDNPKLYNPIDWKWIITTVIGLIAAIAAIAALFVACGLSK